VRVRSKRHVVYLRELIAAVGIVLINRLLENVIIQTTMVSQPSTISPSEQSVAISSAFSSARRTAYWYGARRDWGFPQYPVYVGGN